jgi:hypothetical protein
VGFEEAECDRQRISISMPNRRKIGRTELVVTGSPYVVALPCVTYTACAQAKLRAGLGPELAELAFSPHADARSSA